MAEWLVSNGEVASPTCHGVVLPSPHGSVTVRPTVLLTNNSFSRDMGNNIEAQAWSIVRCHNRLRELLQVASCDVKETAASWLYDQVT